jgi:hypothetical protein
MMMNVDKFFILELQERGFDIDYNKIVEIYRASRERPGCKARKLKNQREREYLDKLMKEEGIRFD